jgi:hypothetical protein
MVQPRPLSLGAKPEREAIIDAAQSLHARLDKANVHLLQHVAEFKANKLDQDQETENIEPRDPAIVAAEVGAQLVCLGTNPSPYRTLISTRL